MGMSTLQVNTIETNTPAGVLAVRDVDNALTAIQPGAVRGTAAATAPVFQDSAGAQIGTLCRAWVNFNGQGTVAIRAAFNVSTITDNGVGQYTVNFATPMPDANYAVTNGKDQTVAGGTFCVITLGTYTTSGFSVLNSQITNGSSTIDVLMGLFAVFR
jgi:hypothetical protein